MHIYVGCFQGGAGRSGPLRLHNINTNKGVVGADPPPPPLSDDACKAEKITLSFFLLT